MTTNTATIEELEIARSYVEEQLESRSFTEHPEDRDELWSKLHVLNVCLNPYYNQGRVEVAIPLTTEY